MSPLTLGIILAVYALVMWVVVFLVWARGYREWKANRAARPWQVKASVVAKREVASSGRPADASIEVEPAKQFVTFGLEGRQKELQVPASTYPTVEVGQEGTLYLRGEQFEEFEPKMEGEDADDVYRRMVKG